MPTGYTHAVQNGTVTTLEAFALQCARAFGATILMRDEPSDAPIPARFEPNSFYARNTAQAQARLDKLGAMSPMEAQRHCQQEYSSAMARWRDRSIQDAIHRVRYKAMLTAVHNWSAPTVDHFRFKAFMVEQLQSSLDHDCGGQHNSMPCIQRWPDWLKDEIQKETSYLVQSGELEQGEHQRTNSRNDWLASLRASLATAA